MRRHVRILLKYEAEVSGAGSTRRPRNVRRSGEPGSHSGCCALRDVFASAFFFLSLLTSSIDHSSGRDARSRARSSVAMNFSRTARDT